MRGRHLLMLACALAGCAYPPPRNDTAALEPRVAALENRVERLETGATARPVASRAQIEAEIGALERERIQLLVRYNEQHPAVVAVDRRLAVLREELRGLD